LKDNHPQRASPLAFTRRIAAINWDDSTGDQSCIIRTDMSNNPANILGITPCFIEVRARMAAKRTASSRAPHVSSVSIHPGAIALTRMSSAAQATVSDFVSCTIAPFEAE